MGVGKENRTNCYLETIRGKSIVTTITSVTNIVEQYEFMSQFTAIDFCLIVESNNITEITKIG
jgi:hypothetical protein